MLSETFEQRVRERTSTLECERKRALDLAERDQLTGLANRRRYAMQIDEAVDRAKSDGESFALILVDLDGFKALNDTYGHAAGDFVLKCVAERISKLVRRDDLVARLGGDEFAIIAAGPVGERSKQLVANRLISAIQAPMCYEERRIFCGVSLGIAHCPEHAAKSEDLQRFADLALYRAKAAGRGCNITFERRFAEEHDLRTVMGLELREALSTDAVGIHYQPVVDLGGAKMAGLEALLRWRHPTRGQIAPLDLLAIADDHNLLPLLTRYVVRKSIFDTKPHIVSGMVGWVSINLTANDLHDRELPDYIVECIAEIGLDAKHAKFEITEQTVVSDAENVNHLMTVLSRAGCRFAIDDFGSGYSNLLSLSQLPFHTLKIDRSFIDKLAEGAEAQTFVRAIIELAKAFELEVIAEGVESPTQAHLLRQLGCDLGQGYFFGGPTPALTHFRNFPYGSPGLEETEIRVAG